MKKFLLLIIAIAFINETKAQTIIAGGNLDINNIKAEVNSDGSLFWNFATGQFEVPKGSGVQTIFANALWSGAPAIPVVGQFNIENIPEESVGLVPVAPALNQLMYVSMSHLFSFQTLL